ncbi:LamG-like jellyroll fold domain-containing protein [Pontibacter oryzae]|uniref:T9SS C-terminal target domain-containing protein n=1 Tax=Pontibacter oryzae TaxID=2304593 RepID=A0A399RX45_9BACT|nr:LamG-like jellyroll fold domain-containing protein [Pontibacter oryzae]RIJ34372.1 T9SS C-terminal target domain-containing protein [Pontibacter oryzae]
MTYLYLLRQFSAGKTFLKATSWFVLALVTSFLSPFAVFAQSGCPDGLVHYFGLDETSSGSYSDYASPSVATCTDCPAASTGLFNGAQRFSGSKNGLTLTDIEKFEWGPNSNFTMELWMKASGTSSDNQVFIGRDAKDSEMMWWLGMSASGKPRFELYDRDRTGFGIVGEDIKINDDRWHHIVVVRDGRLRVNKLYVDGYSVGSYQFDYTASFESSSPINIGFLDLNKGFGYTGQLDELMVYNRALSETEVRARFNNGAGSYCGPQQVKPMIMSEAVTHGVVDQKYTYDVQAVGNPAPVFALADAPSGMQLDSKTGQITWTPTAEGNYKVIVTATNSSGSDRQEFTVAVKKGIGEKTGMIHHWMLHEINGSRYRDFYTPYDATCSQEARPKPVNGVVSGGQEFDGQDDGLNVEESYNFDWEANETFTIEVWLRTNGSTSGNRVLIGRDAKDSEAHWWVGLDGEGRAGFQLLDLEWQGIFVGGAGAKLNDNVWHQVVAVRNGKSGLTELYVDGAKVASGSHTYTHGFASRSAVNIGYLNDGNGYHYEGILDEVKLFGRALTADEIEERYSSVFDAITELVRFEGQYIGGSIQLTWETAAEANLSHFVVERSEDMEAFEPLGEVKANGNSNTAIIYNFNDIAPLQTKNYYRLKIMKEDGKYTYSKIIMIEFGGPTATFFKIYPNPIEQGEVTAELSNLPSGEVVQFYVADLRGKRLVQEQMQVDDFGQLQIIVPITEVYRPGMYTLTVISSKRIISRKLIVRR